MTPLDWQYIKKQIYYQDGSWRDIYIRNTQIEDWGRWIDLVNDLYPLRFCNGKTGSEATAIDKTVVFDYFSHRNYWINVEVQVGNITVNCHFFDLAEIENDIDPAQISSEEDHEILIQYLVQVSSALGKPVILTAENIKELNYIRVEEEKVTLVPDP